jgi:hypothetical protein
MSYAKSLRNSLKDKNEGFYGKFLSIEEKAKALLPYTVSKFPSFTPHFSLHSENVEGHLNWLIPDEIKLKMSDNEIFFLLVAAWLHDWGMIAQPSEDSDQVRAQHHIRTEKNFETQYQLLNLSIDEARIIGRICRGHRKDDLHSTDYKDLIIGINNLIRVRFLASLLRLADECDVTENRTPQIIYYNLKPEGISDEEFKKHLLIRGIGNRDQYPYKIFLYCIANSPKGVEVVERVKNQIQMQLDSVKLILAANEIEWDIVEIEIETHGFINKPIAFQLDRKSIVDLLIGSALYSREDVAVRELMQNCIDTCRFRKAMDISYIPRIEIEFDEESITFKDNGMGMNFEDALDHFSKKGSSFYISNDFKNVIKGKNFDPISKFGIGVLSTFLIANKMVAHTKKQGSSSCKFSISDLVEGWTYEEGTKQDSGTEITLYLKNEKKGINLFDALNYYCKKIEIPIIIKNRQTGISQEIHQQWDYEIPEVKSEIDKDITEKIYDGKPKLTLTGDFPDFEVIFYIFKDIRFEQNNCFVSNHGIYVGSHRLFPAINNNWVALINLKSGIIDLAVSRDDFIKNDKYSKFLSQLTTSLIEIINRHVNETFSKESDLQKIERVSSMLNIFFLNFLGTPIETPQAIILHQLVKERKYPILTNKGESILSFEEIVKKGYKSVIHYQLPTSYFLENMDIVRLVLQPRLSSTEIIVFDFGPCLKFIKKPRQFICSFCELLKKTGIESFQCHELSDILQKMDYPRINTSIDSLLPPNCYFTHMPENLRGLVAQTSSFNFSLDLESEASSNSVRLSYYHDLVAIELFSDDSDLINFYETRFFNKKEKIKCVSQGKFVYDCDDPFLKTLISKSDEILRDVAFQKVCSKYLRFLALQYLSTGLRNRVRRDSELLIIYERVIQDLLKIPYEYPEREGKLTKIYHAIQ